MRVLSGMYWARNCSLDPDPSVKAECYVKLLSYLVYVKLENRASFSTITDSQQQLVLLYCVVILAMKYILVILVLLY